MATQRSIVLKTARGHNSMRGRTAGRAITVKAACLEARAAQTRREMNYFILLHVHVCGQRGGN